MRLFFAIGLASMLSLSSFAQAPLSVDQNTIALWNFDNDTELNVTDQGTHNIQGTSVNSKLLPFPGVQQLGNSRFFVDQTSFVTFGTLSPNSPLDLLSLNEWSVEFITQWDRRPTGPRVIFDNGQISIKMLDFKFSVTLDLNGVKYGVMTKELSLGAHPYRTAVVFKDNKLAILVDGKVKASTDIILSKKSLKSRLYNQPIRVGGAPSQNVSNFKIGRLHACLSTENGELKCWGNNDNSQLGDRTTNFYFMPVNVEGLKNVSSISIGEFFTCAVKEGLPYCWGRDNYFSLGTDYQGPYRSIPLAVPGVTGATDIQSGNNHTCTLLTDKTVKCWGRNESGQLGMGSYFPAGYPFTATISDVKQIVTGGEHVCALKTDGTVWCWGNNSRGQIGQYTFAYATSATPMQVPIATVKSIAAGMNHSCAVIQNGDVYCWGANEFGQIGNGTNNDSGTPIQVQSLNTVAELSAGYGNHTCAVQTSGRMSCWGQNDRSQLGIAPSPSSNVPVMTNEWNVSKFSVGGKTNCLQRKDHSLYCFGSNSFGMLGDGSIYASTVFPSVVLATEQNHFPGYIDDIRISDIARFEVKKPELTVVSSTSVNESKPAFNIAVNSQLDINPNSININLNGNPASGLVFQNNQITGQLLQDLLVYENTIEIRIEDINGNEGKIYFKIYFNPSINPTLPIKVLTRNNTTCSLNGEGLVSCWGSNMFGQLGSEFKRYSSTPVTISNLKNIIDIAISADTVCALDKDKDVYCLGDNTYGKLGTNDPSEYRSFPKKISFPSPVSKLIAGYNTFCVILTNGKVSCWGENGFWTYLPGGNYAYPYPVTLNGLTSILDGSIGRYHSCFIDSDKQLFCQGHNSAGQIGNGNYGQQNPIFKVNLPNVIKVSVGHLNTCAITEDHKLYCWGQNLYKQLGIDPTNTDYAQTIPREVLVVSEVYDVQVGENFVCASNASNELTCWGQNSHGEIGNGTLTRHELSYEHSTPLIQFSSFGNTTCGISVDNKIYCWGLNSIGQAGNAYNTYTTIPTEVIPHQDTLPLLTDLLSGQANTCMRRSGDLYCWGNNEQGQIGTDSGNFNETYPVKVSEYENSPQYSIGYGLICYKTQGNQVACSGFNNFGQAGQNPSQFQRVTKATIIPNLYDVKEVKAGLDFACALKNDGTIWCWGNQSLGQLGSAGGRTHIPRQVETVNVNDALFKKLYVSARGYYSCAQTLDNRYACWGDNSRNQYLSKDDGVPGFLRPVYAEIGSGAKHLALGAYFACALSTSNKVFCRGDNSRGQLGGDGPGWNLQAVELKNDVQSLTAGENHACVLDNQNQVYCWGYNLSGQLGNGTLITSKYPIKVISNVKEVSAGSEHTCAIGLNNKLICWGFNGNGQFGNGTIVSSSTPIFSDITK